jgi:flavin reductase (DIM6/NTAB) family NADH-FMN oxidoreductase RutF
MHKAIEPAILYFGTPVAVLSTLNEDGTPNLAPMSSVWWLGWSCMLGLGAASKTSENLIRSRECVINLPSAEQVSHVDRLALTTGRDPVPEYKARMGYRHEPDKFGVCGFTPMQSETITPPRVKECPVQMEAIVHEVRPFGNFVTANAFEMHIQRVYIEEQLLFENEQNRIDPERWKPLIMSFRQFFGLGDIVHPSRLGEGPESMYARRRPASVNTEVLVETR